MSDVIDPYSIPPELVEAAFRLGHEGVWAHVNGESDGQPIIVIYAVGDGARNLQRIIDTHCVKDPRSQEPT